LPGGAILDKSTTETGGTMHDAIATAKALSLRVLADRIAHGEAVPEMDELFSVTP
jgi:hypothetical protein